MQTECRIGRVRTEIKTNYNIPRSKRRLRRNVQAMEYCPPPAFDKLLEYRYSFGLPVLIAGISGIALFFQIWKGSGFPSMTETGDGKFFSSQNSAELSH